jgi:hypothetical protein
MSVVVLVFGNVFDGISATLTGPAEILVEGNRIGTIERSLGRPPGARVIDLPERTVSKKRRSGCSCSITGPRDRKGTLTTAQHDAPGLIRSARCTGSSPA